MSEKPAGTVGRAEFQRGMHEFLERLIHSQLELASLAHCLIAKGVVSEEDLRQAREQVKSEAKALLDNLSVTNPEKLFGMLQEPEGPVQ